MFNTIPSLISSVTIRPWHYIALISTLFLMHPYDALEAFFQAVQEMTFNGDVNHRQHFTLIDEIPRSFRVLR